MCKAYRELVKDWKQEGREEGKEEGDKHRLIKDIQNLMDSLRLTAEQAMDALKIEGQEREDYYRMIEKS